MKILLPELLKTFEVHDGNNGLTLDIIRRGTSVMFLKHNSITFSDGQNFLPGVSLDEAGKTFDAEVHKSTFPYEYWTDLNTMKAATEWPDFSAFKSTLRPFVIEEPEEKLRKAIEKGIQNGFTATRMIDCFNMRRCCSGIDLTDDKTCPSFSLNDTSSFTLDPILYVESMQMFYELKRNGECNTMHDYLLIYNIRDCIVGLQTFTNMNRIFQQQFGISLLNNFSIPSVALKILWSFYDTEKNCPYSFGEKYPELPIQIRERCYGGISGPIQLRHVEANGDTTKYPDYVTKAPNGKIYRRIKAEDANSLYGYV